RSGSYMVHGAAIKLGDDGILVPSFANTGKTTAAWMLAKGGAKYLTDELAILDSSGNCFSLPCSSLLTSRLIESLGLNLTRKQRLSMRGNNLKSRLLSTRFAPGGIRLNPKDYFLLSDMVRITKAMFLQNGPDEFRKLSLDEATKRLMAIRSFELGWDSNPYLVAESFFNPGFDLEELRKKERAFASAFLSELREVFLISSSNHSHYKMLENQEFPDLSQHQIEDQLRSVTPAYVENSWRMLNRWHAFLYTVTRAVMPRMVIETGVLYGHSSASILAALEDNRRGSLISIDLPLEQHQSITEGGKHVQVGIRSPNLAVGCAVPISLRSRWNLQVGNSLELLPKILQETGSISIFIHDSLHTYDHMMAEFRLGYDALELGGLLISDDIGYNLAWQDS